MTLRLRFKMWPSRFRVNSDAGHAWRRCGRRVFQPSYGHRADPYHDIPVLSTTAGLLMRGSGRELHYLLDSVAVWSLSLLTYATAAGSVRPVG